MSPAEASWGALVLPGGVRFRLWAPRATAVAVSIEGADLAMTHEGHGWFCLTTDRAAPGTLYRYVIDGNNYPDPASRRQPQGVHGPSEVVAAGVRRWADTGWRGRRWEEMIVYELHIGTFSDTGDFAGAVAHLDHIVALGATAVELMPVAEFPGARNWGYDGAYLYAPSARYGRPADLQRLVEACHARGLAVILDVVYNHFGPEGNYLAAIAPDFFTEQRHTPWGAAIDFTHRPVRDFMIDNALYWLEEFHCDGLRLDAVHAIADDSDPDIVAEIAQTVRARVTDRPVHLILENDRNEARYLARESGHTAQWNDDLHHALHVLATGETIGFYGDYAADPARLLGRALAEGFAYQGEASPFRGGRRRGEPSTGLPPTAFVAFLQNHDHVGNHPFGTRIAARASAAARHAAIAVVLLSPQIPMLFMGEEWASERPFAFFCDFAPPLADAVRDGRRREFAHFPEFADATARARIPDPTAPDTFARSRLDWDEPGRGGHPQWLARYRLLNDIRAREIIPRLAGIGGGSGRYRVLADRAVLVEWRLGDGARLTALVNFADAPVPVPAVPGRLLYASGDVGGPRTAAFLLAPA